MAPAWPTEAAWPLNHYEHAQNLAKYLEDAENCIEHYKEAPVPANLVKIIIGSTKSLIAKVQRGADLTTVCDKLEIIQTEANTATNGNAEVFTVVKEELKAIKDIAQKAVMTGEAARTAAKEASEVAKTAAGMLREIKNKGPSEGISAPLSYAAAAASGIVAPGSHNIQPVKTMPAQVQREVIVNIRNPLTIQNLRAMNPRSLEAHIERAIAQSGTDSIQSAKIMSCNQLKSGDLSIKAASSAEAQVLRESAETWASLIGNGSSVRSPTYGVIVHGVRTSSMDMDKFESIRDSILADNRPFIPAANTRYIGWLTRSAPSKAASSMIIEFSRPEDANKIIDEGMVWQGEMLQTERYDRQCRLKQCFNCQKYGHIGTQCKATTACGYCAQEHGSRDCPKKSEREGPRKCATCHGNHEAWSQRCPTRKEEMARTKAAYETRSKYHAVAAPATIPASGGTSASRPNALRRKRSARDIGDSSDARPGSFLEARKNKRTQSNSIPVYTGGESDAIEVSQRPQRAHIPSRRALEALAQNALPYSNSQHAVMDIESD